MSQCKPQYAICLMLLAALFVGRLQAATVTWIGVTNSDWSVGTNWAGNAAPVIGDSVILANSGNSPTNQDIAGLILGTLTINDTSAGSYTINGSLLTVTGGITVDPVAGDPTLGLAVAISSAQSWSIGAGRMLTISGLLSGSGPLTLTASGTLLLTNPANSFTGSTTISAGTLRAGAANVLGTNAAYTVTGTLDLNGNSASIGSLAGTGNITLGSTAGTVLAFGANNGSTSYSGTLSGTGGITKNGTGTFTLSSALTYNGPTVVNGGTFKLAVVTVGTVPASPALYYSFDNVAGSTVPNLGTAGPAKDGTLQSNTVLNPALVTTNKGGKIGEALKINQTADWCKIALTGTLGVDLSGGNWTASAWFNTMFPTDPLLGAGNFATGYRTLFRGNTLDHQALVNPVGTTGGFLGVYTNSANVFQGCSYRPDGTAGGPNVMTGWHHLCSVGTGTTTTLYIDGVQVGVSNFKSVADIGAIGNVPNPLNPSGQPFSKLIDEVYIYQRALSAAEVSSLYSAGGGGTNFLPSNTAVSITNNATLDLQIASQAIGSLSAAAGTTLALNSPLTFGDATSTTFAGTVTGGGSLTKVGTGTFTVSGVLGSTTAFILNGGTLDLNGVSQSIGSLAGAAGTSVTLGAVATTNLTVGANGSTTTFNGVISGQGNLVKIGTGAMVLTASNTYTGNTTVTNGTLRAGVTMAPVVYYSFDSVSGTSVTNGGTAGAPKNGILYNTAGITPSGKFGSAMTINASQDWLAIPLTNNMGVDISNTEWTGTAWIQSPYPPAQYRTLFRSNLATGEHQLLAEVNTMRMGAWDGVARAQLPATNFNPTLPVTYNIDGSSPAPSNINITDGNWHHLACVGTAAGTAMYVDGVFVGRTLKRSIIDFYSVGNVFNAPLVGGQPFAQKIDDVCIYQRALSQAEITALLSGPPAMPAPVANILPTTTNISLTAPGILDLGAGAQLVQSLAGLSGALSFNGPLTIAGATSTTYNGSMTGAGSLFKNGAGTLTLGGLWSYAGNTTINGGTLTAAGAGRFAPASTMTVNAGTLNVNGTPQVVGSLAGGVGSQVTLAAGSLTAGGNDASTMFQGTITGTGPFIKNGAGTLTIPNGFGNTGAVTINAGNVIVQTATAFSATSAVAMGANTTLDSSNFSQTIASLSGGANARVIMGAAATTLTVGGNNATTSFGGVISGNTSLVKNGTGTFTLAGVQTYLGSTTVNTGILRLQGSPLDAVAYYSFDNAAGTTIPNGGTAGAAKNGTLNGSATVTSGNGGLRGEALNIPAAGSAFMSIALTGVKGIDLAGGLWTASAWFNGIHPNTLQRSLFASNAPSIDNQIIIQQGNQSLGCANTVGTYVAAAPPLPAGSTGGYNMTGLLTGWHHVAAVGTGATTVMYVDGVLVGTAAVKSVTDIFAVGSNRIGAMPFAQKIDEVYIFQRALPAEEVAMLYRDSQAGGSNVLPPTTALTLNGTSILEMGGGSQELATLIGGATTQYRLSGGRLIVGNGGASFTYAGTITGGGGQLIKNGAGTMTLTGTNNYTGGTVVNGGVMQGNSLGVQGNITNNASVIFDQPVDGNYYGVMSGTGTLTKQNAGTLGISGRNTYSGATIIEAGTLKVAPLAIGDAAVYYSFDQFGAEVTNQGTLGAAKNGIPMNTAIQTPNGVSGAGLNLNGTTGWLQVKASVDPNNAALQVGAYLGTQPYTLSCWFKDIYASATYRTLYRGFNQAAPNDGDHPALMLVNTAQMGFYGQNAGGGWVPATNPPLGATGFDMSPYLTGWHHIVVIGSGTTSDYYIDGQFRGQAAKKSARDLYSICNIPGIGAAAAQPFSAFLDEVFVFNRAISQSEITALYNLAGIAPILNTPILSPNSAVVMNGGALDVNNCIQTVASLSGVAAANVTLGSGVLTTGGNNSNTTFSGVISGTGGIAKAGTGNFTLNGQSTFSGTTSVGAGTLEVANAAGSATGTSAVTATTGGTFTGTGAVTSNVNTTATGSIAVGPTLAPGFGTTTTGSLSLAGNIVFQLTAPDNGATGSGDDEYVVNGNLALGGNLTVLGSGLIQGRYHLFSYTGTVGGTFATYILPDGFAGQIVSGGGSVDLYLNHRPVLAPIGNQSLNEGGTLTFTASATDADPADVLTFSLAGTPPAGASIDPVSGAFTWATVDGPDQTGPITVRVTDNGPGAFFAEETITVTVNNVVPTTAVSGTGNASEGIPYTLNLSATDPGQDTITQWQINWGDGNIEVVNGNPSSVTHSYADGPASWVVTASVKDDDSAGGFYAGTAPHGVTVSNVTPVGTLINSGDVTEGTPSATVTMQNPFDPSPVDQASLHFAFDWDNNGVFDVGDGTYLGSVVSNVTIIPTAFLDDGPATLTIRARVIDKDNASSEYTTTIVISNVAPTASLGLLPPVNEGDTAPVLIGGQFDPSAADTNAGFRYSYDFNYDGVTPQFDLGGNSYAAASFSFNPSIPPSQLPDGPATQTVLARIWDKNDGFSDYTTTITIANVAPALSAINATPIVENSSTTLTATLADPGVLDTFTLIVDWGDGSVESIDLGASATGVTALSYGHQYLDDNAVDSYTITLSVLDNDGDSDQQFFNVIVSNANPVVSIPNGLTPHLQEGSSVGLITLATFTDSGTLDTHSVTINWGDGSPLDTGATLIEPAGATPGSIQANHLFDDGPGVRMVTVTVTDDDNGVGVATFNVIVDNVNPTATFQRPDAGSPTQMTSVEFINAFDSSTADTTQGLLYSYDWDNDGTFEVAFSSVTAMTIPPQYLSTSPNHTIHGRITDKDGGLTDYYLQQPAFTSKTIEIEFDLGAQSSYTLVAAAQPAPNYSVEVIDLPEGIANLAAIGLSFDGVATISGVPFVGGLLTLRATASNLAGIEVIDLIIKIKRPVNSNNPRIISAAQANPNPCITGTPVTFSVVATDSDGDVLSYYWTFADGSNARGRVVNHTYTVPGTYVVVVSVSDGKNDGVFDQFNLVVAKGTDNTFDVQQAKLSFDFRKPERSTLYMTGYIPIPSGPIAGVTANVSITGTTYAQAFVFDAKGAAGDTMSLFSVKTIQTGSGTSRAKFVFSLKSTNGQDPLNPSLFQKIGNLFPAKTDRAGEIVPVPLVVTIGAQPTVTNTVPMTYKVVPNRSGKGQFKRK